MLGNTQFDPGRSKLGSHRIRLCLQNHNLNMSIIIFLFSPWSVQLWGGLRFWVPMYPRQGSMTLDVMLPMGTFLLQDTTKVGDETKQAVPGCQLGSFQQCWNAADCFNQAGEIIMHVKFVQSFLHWPTEAKTFVFCFKQNKCNARKQENCTHKLKVKTLQSHIS